MATYELDATRLLCPLPLLRVQAKSQELVAGDILTVTCTDPGVLYDLPAWCRMHGHEFLTVTRQQRTIIISIQIHGCNATLSTSTSNHPIGSC